MVNTIATVTDWLDTKLDQAEVKAARMEELKKIQVDFEGFTPVRKQRLPSNAVIKRHKWVDKKSKGFCKSRNTCADI